MKRSLLLLPVMAIIVAGTVGASDQFGPAPPANENKPTYELVFEKWKIESSGHRPGPQDTTLVYQRLYGKLLPEVLVVPEWGDVQVATVRQDSTASLTSGQTGLYLRAPGGAVLRWSDGAEYKRKEPDLWNKAALATKPESVMTYVSRAYFTGNERVAFLVILLDGRPAPIPILLVDQLGRCSRGSITGDALVAHDWPSPLCPEGSKATYVQNGPIHRLSWHDRPAWERFCLPEGAYLIHQGGVPRGCIVRQHPWTHRLELENESGSRCPAEFTSAHRLRLFGWDNMNATLVFTGSTVNIVYAENRTEWTKPWTPTPTP